MHKLLNITNMRISELTFIVAIAGMISSCCKTGQLCDVNGHNLWFHSLSEGKAQILSEDKSTMSIADNEIHNYWKGKQTVSCLLLNDAEPELGNGQ